RESIGCTRMITCFISFCCFPCHFSISFLCKKTKLSSQNWCASSKSYRAKAFTIKNKTYTVADHVQIILRHWWGKQDSLVKDHGSPTCQHWKDGSDAYLF